MSSTVAILRAEAADVEAILRVQKAAFTAEALLYGDWTIAPLVETPDAVRADLASKVVLKATLDGALVGSVRAALSGGTCAVGRLSVDPKAQRRGIGLALLHAAEEAFPEALQVELFTGERSEGNLRLYRRAGYIATGDAIPTGKVTLIYLRKARSPFRRPAHPDRAARPVSS